MLKIEFFQMALNTCKIRSKGIKIAFFVKKITKNRPAVGGFAPRPLPRIHLSYTGLLDASPALHIVAIELGV